MSDFPNPQYYPFGNTQGVTLRDKFALEAMKDIAWHPESFQHGAKLAYEIADAMLEARDEK